MRSSLKCRRKLKRTANKLACTKKQLKLIVTQTQINVELLTKVQNKFQTILTLNKWFTKDNITLHLINHIRV